MFRIRINNDEKSPMPLKFYNSLSRQIEPFVPLHQDAVRLYTCGPTVYNYAHIGNFRAYVFEDLLRRTLKYCGYRVIQAMNLTDVDDKTIRGARAAGQSLDEFTKLFKRAFFEDIKTLRIEPAEHYPAATEHLPEMIELIQRLLDRGVAYRADDGSVYFSIGRYPQYGRLTKIKPEDMRSTGRVRNDEYAKEAVADFALWKAYQEEDGAICWDSPWGRGRPGWHIECSAMSMKYLSPSFDIHTGGIDNMFPHHEDEIAQSEAATGQPFARYWLHCAHLVVDGQKMSKSLGNFFTLRDLLEQGLTGREIRYVLLGGHYRQSLNFSLQSARDARAALQRLDDFAARLRQLPNSTETDAPGIVQPLLERAETQFRQALEDDLNMAEALAALFSLIRDVNRQIDQQTLARPAADATLALLREFDRVLAVLDLDREPAVPAEIESLAEARQEARRQRDFAQADAIRDRLLAEGWLIEDTPAGPRLKPAN